MDVTSKIYLGLFAFGIVYAAIVYVLHKHEFSEGFTALLVVVGCSITLGGCYMIERETGRITTLIVFGAFACSGLPMVIGDLVAYLLRRQNGRRVFDQVTEQTHDRPT
jgi:membrane protein DedA with SNARE-associated domain